MKTLKISCQLEHPFLRYAHCVGDVGSVDGADEVGSIGDSATSPMLPTSWKQIWMMSVYHERYTLSFL